MKKVLFCVLIAGVALIGCAKKEIVSPKERQARMLLVEGTAFLKTGDAVKAVESFATAIKTAPDYFEGYYMLGETFLRLKQFPQAAGVMAAAVHQFPDNGLAYYLLAVAYEGAGEPIKAIVSARRSAELFNAKGDKIGVQKAAILLATLVASAKQQAEAQMADNAKAEADKAVQDRSPESLVGEAVSVPVVEKSAPPAK